MDLTPSFRRASIGLLLSLIVAGTLLGCGTLDEKQRAWIFQPSKSTWGGSARAAEGMDDVWIDFQSAEAGQPVRLNALWLAQPQADAPVLLYLHGARWNVRSSATRMRRLHSLGFAVLGVDYRGFGLSTDTLPSETLAYEDARAAWDWLAQQHPQRARFVFGHSLGAAIAVHLAGQVSDESGVILEGSFPSIADVVAASRWGWLPVSPLITQRFAAGERVAAIGSPLLVVHGSADRLIPPELGRALYDKAIEPKRFELVDGGSHHNTNAVGLDQYRAAVHAVFGLVTDARLSLD
jgi:alpha-beta hydrolase superfamily lysophospholipase